METKLKKPAEQPMIYVPSEDEVVAILAANLILWQTVHTVDQIRKALNKADLN